MKKKILSSMLCISMALAVAAPLAACGGGDGLNPDGTWWKTTGELNKDAAGNVVFDDISIRLTHIVAGKDKAFYNRIINKFNDEYSGKIYINATSVGEGDFDKTVVRDVKSKTNNAPDFIMGHQKSMKNLYEYKSIQPIDLAMNETGVKTDLTAFAEGVNQYAKVGTDKTFGVPVDAAGMVVFCNYDLLKEKCNKETAPATRSELLDVCQTYKNATGKCAISWETAGDFFCKNIMPTAVLQNGGHLFKEDYYGDWYDDTTQREIFKKSIQSVRDIIDSGYAQKSLHEGGGTQAFLDDEAIFYVTTPWYREDIVNGYVTNKATKGITITLDDAEAKIKGASISGWFAMSDETGENAKKIYGDSHMFAMTSKVEDINEKAAICEFINWFTQQPEVGAQWADAGHITLSKTIGAAQEYTANKNVVNFINKWYPDIDYITPMGITPYCGDLSGNLESLLSQALLNDDGSQDEVLIQTKQNALNSQIDVLKLMSD